jgi:hypothetical protein
MQDDGTSIGRKLCGAFVDRERDGFAIRDVETIVHLGRRVDASRGRVDTQTGSTRFDDDDTSAPEVKELFGTQVDEVDLRSRFEA